MGRDIVTTTVKACRWIKAKMQERVEEPVDPCPCGGPDIGPPCTGESPCADRHRYEFRYERERLP